MQAASNVGTTPSAPDAPTLRVAPTLQESAIFGRAMEGASRTVPVESPPATMGPRLSRSLFDPTTDAMLHIDEQAAVAWMGRTSSARPAPPAAPMGQGANADPAHATDASSADLAFVPAESVAPATDVLPAAPDAVPQGRAADFQDLRVGQRDATADGPIVRMQRVLHRWNPRLDVPVDGHYDERTAQAVLLYKAVYGTGADGRRIDPTTAGHVAKMEDGTFWRNPPQKTAAGRLLYAASQQLGKPYRLGGDGVLSTDCGLLTRDAMRRAGLADPSFSRLADEQFRYAEAGQQCLSLTKTPRAGDLVFFNHPTHQSSQAYRGITHVGIFVADGYMLAASSGRGRVVMQKIDDLAPHIGGYARPGAPAAALLSDR